MNENTNILLSTPQNLGRQRSIRQSKERANLKIAASNENNKNYFSSPKIPKSASCSAKKCDNMRRAKSQIIIKSKHKELAKDENTENDEVSSEDEDSEYFDSDSSEMSDVSLSDSDNNVSEEERVEEKPKRTLKRSKTVATFARKSVSVPPRARLTGTIDSIAETRNKLRVGFVPDDLPCRENEINNIYTFLYSNLISGKSGCMCVSGVPGTGKTATVTSIIDYLQSVSSSEKDAVVPLFRKLIVNAMHVSEPREIYALIYQELTEGRRTSLKHSSTALESELNKCRQPIVLVIDEIDKLCNRKQDVLYRIFSWMKNRRSRLVLVTISNTMDLAERVLHQRVSSRIGLTRVAFEPYSPQQLVSIIEARLGTAVSATFHREAIELASRKVAAVSGDARRALDICRRALELHAPTADKPIDLASINAVINEMYSAPKIIAIKQCCSFFEKLFLKSIVATFKSLGFEEAVLQDVITHFSTICSTENVRTPNDSEIFSLLTNLASFGLLIFDNLDCDVKLKLRLKCSQQDVLYALDS